MNFLRRHKFLFLSIILFGCFVLIKPVHAQIGSAAAGLVASLLVLVVDILGKVLVVLMHILIWIASYNDFVNSAAVSSGWTILRDVCNMFFILILLVIAFATVLNIEGYSWKKLLPKMILMAVLINFSKLICGVVIDFAQVIMLTFVNGFRDIGGGNLATMLGIPDLLKINSDSIDPVTTLTIAGTYLLALLYVIVSIGVIVIILFVLVMRIVMLWILVTLSPLAFLLWSLPATSQYASKWRSQFTENVVSGPVLAFFIWLSFASATYNVGDHSQVPNGGNVSEAEQKYLAATAGLSKSGSTDGMLKFFISIAMLVGGVIITKDIGSAAGKAVGYGQSVNKWARKKTGEAAKSAGKSTAQVGLRSAGSLTNFAGQGISKLTNGAMGEATKKRGDFLTGWGKDIKKTQDDAATARKLKTLNKFGIKKEGLKGLEEYSKASFGGQMTAAALSGSPMELYKAAVVRTWRMNWMGGKLKNFSTNLQEKSVQSRTDKNVKKTGQVVEDIERKLGSEKAKKHENITKARDSKISTYNDGEKTEIQKENDLHSAALLSAAAVGASPRDIEKLNKEHSDKLSSINTKYNTLREAAHSEHREETTKGEDGINKAYMDDLTSAKHYHEKAKSAKSLLEEKKALGDEKTKIISELEEDRSKKIKHAEKLFENTPAARDEEVNKINKDHDAKIQDVNDSHSRQEQEIEGKYKDALPVDISPNLITKLSDKAGNALEQYNPIELTNAAIKKGLEAMKHAAEIFAAIGFKKIGELGKASFTRGARGIDETTTNVWTMLAKGDAEALNKLKNMSDELAEIKNRPDGPSPQEKKVIQGMKEGLGVFLRDKPGSKSNFTVFIENLDKIDTGLKVDDFTQGKREKNKASKKNKAAEDSEDEDS